MFKIISGLVFSAFIFAFVLLPVFEIFCDLTRGHEGHTREVVGPQIEAAAERSDDHDRSVVWLRAKQAELAKAKEAKQKAAEAGKTKRRGKRH